MPTRPWRRVALYQCRCGIAGCGVIAARVAGDEPGLVTWSDFRDYTGVFFGPVPFERPRNGRRWPLPDLVFDARSYRPEVGRAAADRPWETLARSTARLIADQLRAAGERLLAGGLELGWSEPVRGDADLYTVCLWRAGQRRSGVNQLVFSIRGIGGPALTAAQDVVERIIATPVDELVERYPRMW